MKNFFIATHASEMVYDFIREYDLKPLDTKLGFVYFDDHQIKQHWHSKQDYQNLKALGFNLTKINLKEVNEAKLYNLLCNMDVIFVADSIINNLVDIINTSRFRFQMQELINDGKIFFGSGSGSMILHEDQSVFLPKNSNKGIDAIQFLPVPIMTGDDPHKLTYNNFSQLPRLSSTVLVITNKQALIVHGEIFRLINQGDNSKTRSV